MKLGQLKAMLQASALPLIVGAVIFGPVPTKAVAGGLVAKATTVPVAPYNASAVAGVGSVQVTWAVSPGATSYSIYRSTAATSGFAKVGACAGPPFLDKSVSVAVGYYYAVTAVNATGESAKSNIAGPVYPSSAGPATLTVGITGSSIWVNWSSVAGASKYNVYRSSSPFTGFLLRGNSATTTFNDTAGMYGVPYYYQVTALVGSIESPRSPVAGPVTLAIPAPTNVSAVTSPAGMIVVNWQAVSGVSAYKVYRSPNSANGFLLVGVAALPTYTDTGAAVGVGYYYKVSAIVIGAESPLSNAAGPAYRTH